MLIGARVRCRSARQLTDLAGLLGVNKACLTTDRGSQYAAQAYRSLLHNHGLIGSIARRGNRYDNAMIESFMKTLKVEAVYPMAFESAEDIASPACRASSTAITRDAYARLSAISIPTASRRNIPAPRSTPPYETVRPQRPAPIGRQSSKPIDRRGAGECRAAEEEGRVSNPQSPTENNGSPQFSAARFCSSCR